MADCDSLEHDIRGLERAVVGRPPDGEGDGTGLAGLRALVKQNQEAIDALRGSPPDGEGDGTGLAGLRALVKQNQEAIDALRGRLPDGEGDGTGLAGLRALVRQNQAAIDALPKSPPDGGGGHAEADLQALRADLMKWTISTFLASLLAIAAIGTTLVAVLSAGGAS